MSERTPSLAELMAAMGLPGLTQREQKKRGNMLAREYVCQSFAAAWLQTFDTEQAYRQIHPKVGNGKWARNDILKRAQHWWRQKSVQQHVRTAVQKALKSGQLSVMHLAQQLQEDVEADIFDFAKWDPEGNFTGWKFDVANMTKAQRRSVRGIRPTRYGLEVVMYDRQVSQQLTMKLIELTRKLGQSEEGETVPGELIRQIEQVNEKRQALLGKLPASRLRLTIEGESKPV